MPTVMASRAAKHSEETPPWRRSRASPRRPRPLRSAQPIYYRRCNATTPGPGRPLDTEAAEINTKQSGSVMAYQLRAGFEAIAISAALTARTEAANDALKTDMTDERDECAVKYGAQSCSRRRVWTSVEHGVTRRAATQTTVCEITDTCCWCRLTTVAIRRDFVYAYLATRASDSHWNVNTPSVGFTPSRISYYALRGDITQNAMLTSTVYWIIRPSDYSALMVIKWTA